MPAVNGMSSDVTTKMSVANSPSGRCAPVKHCTSPFTNHLCKRDRNSLYSVYSVYVYRSCILEAIYGDFVCIHGIYVMSGKAIGYLNFISLYTIIVPYNVIQLLYSQN